MAAVVCPLCSGVFQLNMRPVAAPAIPAYRRPQQRSNRALWIGSMIFGLVTVSLLAAGIVLYVNRAKPPAGTHEPYRSTEFNYSFLLPSVPWQKDDATRKELGVNSLCYRKANPDAWVALAVRDFKKRRPISSDLIDEAKRTLNSFHEVETEPGSDGTLAGQPALRLVYRGKYGKVPVSGDVYMLAYRGIGYWLYRWCPSSDIAAAQPWLDDLRDRFGLLDGRANWEPERRNFTSSFGSLNDANGRWRKAPHPAKEYDTKADLVLEATERDDLDDPTCRATLMVLAIDGDLAAAKAYALDRQRDVYPDSQIADEVVAEGIVRLRVTNNKSRERLLIVAVHKGTAIVAEADWSHREYWESELRQFVTTFRPAKP